MSIYILSLFLSTYLFTGPFFFLIFPLLTSLPPPLSSSLSVHHHIPLKRWRVGSIPPPSSENLSERITLLHKQCQQQRQHEYFLSWSASSTTAAPLCRRVSCCLSDCHSFIRPPPQILLLSLFLSQTVCHSLSFTVSIYHSLSLEDCLSKSVCSSVVFCYICIMYI